jgi:hypothetical protein
LRDALLGLAAGLIAALLGIALYEALSNRRRGLEALRRRAGASAAVALSARGALREDAADRLIGALEPARRSDGASVVVVEALDDPQAVERVIELVADVLSARGDSVAAPPVRSEDDGPAWSAVRGPRAGGAGAVEPALVTAEPELAGRSYDWILLPGASARPGEGDAVVLAVHVEDVRSAGAAGLARRGAEATNGPRVIIALKG